MSMNACTLMALYPSPIPVTASTVLYFNPLAFSVIPNTKNLRSFTTTKLITIYFTSVMTKTWSIKTTRQGKQRFWTVVCGKNYHAHLERGKQSWSKLVAEPVPELKLLQFPTTCSLAQIHSPSIKNCTIHGSHVCKFFKTSQGGQSDLEAWGLV